MIFPEFVLKNVLRRKFRTVLTTVGVAVAIAAVVGLLSITGGYERSTRDTYVNRGVDMVVSCIGVADRATSTLDEKVAERFREIEGVAKVAPSLSHTMEIEGQSGVPMNGWPLDSFAYDALHFTQGERFKAGEEKGILLGSSIAESLNKKVGDKVTVLNEEYEVRGIFETVNVTENRKVIISLKDLQEIMEREGNVSEFQIALDKSSSNRQALMQAVKDKVENLKDEQGEKLGLLAQRTEDFVQTDNRLRIARAMAWVTSAIALVVGAIGMLNTMIVSVLERTQEIGILRAIGWRKIRIVRMILVEAFTLSVFGAIAGTAIAAIMVKILMKLPVAQGFVNGQITLDVVAIGFLMSLLVGLVGGAYPALRGASLPPTEALRYE